MLHGRRLCRAERSLYRTLPKEEEEIRLEVQQVDLPGLEYGQEEETRQELS